MNHLAVCMNAPSPLQRNRAELRQQHVPADELHAAAARGGAGVLGAAARERPVLAAQGVPGRERRRARQLPLRVPRA